MEAVSAALRLPARLRSDRFEQECERLRPLGEAYVLRHFGGGLGRADAEEAVSEVILRLHRRMTAGQVPDNLRAVFFTAVRNAAIDLLRSSSAKPTVSLDVAMEAPAAGATPAEGAEARQSAERLQEALARMRDNYRETILLRFGLGLTVPEIAAHFEISLPAAKKRVLRATAQVRKRMEAIEGEEFCPQMRELARERLFEKEASDMAGAAETQALHAHFAHCGSCRSFLVNLRGELHELGAGMLATLAAGGSLDGDPGFLAPLNGFLETAGQLGHGVAEKVRHLVWRGGSGSLGEGAAGVALGTGQKIAAVCGAGAAATATCLLGGATVPGIGASTHASDPPHRPAAKVRTLSSEAPPESSPASSEAVDGAENPEPSAPVDPPSPKGNGTPPLAGSEPVASPNVTPTPNSSSDPPPSEFGIEGGSTGGSAGTATSPASAPESSSAAARPSGSSGGAGFGGGGAAASAPTGGAGSVGFQG